LGDLKPELTELKFDGYRLMVRQQDATVRVYTRRGADWTKRFPHLAAADLQDSR